MTILRIGYTSPQRVNNKPKSILAEPATTASPMVELVADHSLVNWQQFQQDRAQVISDQCHHSGLILYRDIAFGELRQQLQRMIGVDLYA